MLSLRLVYSFVAAALTLGCGISLARAQDLDWPKSQVWFERGSYKAGEKVRVFMKVDPSQPLQEATVSLIQENLDKKVFKNHTPQAKFAPTETPNLYAAEFIVPHRGNGGELSTSVYAFHLMDGVRRGFTLNEHRNGIKEPSYTGLSADQVAPRLKMGSVRLRGEKIRIQFEVSDDVGLDKLTADAARAESDSWYDVAEKPYFRLEGIVNQGEIGAVEASDIPCTGNHLKKTCTLEFPRPEQQNDLKLSIRFGDTVGNHVRTSVPIRLSGIPRATQKAVVESVAVNGCLDSAILSFNSSQAPLWMVFYRWAADPKEGGHIALPPGLSEDELYNTLTSGQSLKYCDAGSGCKAELDLKLEGSTATGDLILDFESRNGLKTTVTLPAREVEKAKVACAEVPRTTALNAPSLPASERSRFSGQRAKGLAEDSAISGSAGKRDSAHGI